MAHLQVNNGSTSPLHKLYNTSYKTVPSQHGLPPRVFAQLKVCAVSREGVL